MIYPLAMELSFIVRGAPVSWKRARTRGTHFFVDSDTRAAKERVALCARAGTSKEQREAVFDQPVSLTCTFIFKPPAWKSQKGKHDRALAGEVPHRVKPDLDNLVKLIKDALNKLVWKDDCQVVEVHAFKRYGDDPRTEVMIEGTVGDD